MHLYMAFWKRRFFIINIGTYGMAVMKLWRAVTTNTSWICVCSVYSGGLSKISNRRFITPKMYSPAFRRLKWRRLNNSSFVVGFKPAAACSLRWYSTPRYGHSSNPCYDSLHRQGNIFLRGFWSCGCTYIASSKTRSSWGKTSQLGKT